MYGSVVGVGVWECGCGDVVGVGVWECGDVVGVGVWECGDVVGVGVWECGCGLQTLKGHSSGGIMEWKRIKSCGE